MIHRLFLQELNTNEETFNKIVTYFANMLKRIKDLTVDESFTFIVNLAVINIKNLSESKPEKVILKKKNYKFLPLSIPKTFDFLPKEIMKLKNEIQENFSVTDAFVNCELNTCSFPLEFKKIDTDNMKRHLDQRPSIDDPKLVDWLHKAKILEVDDRQTHFAKNFEAFESDESKRKYQL